MSIAATIGEPIIVAVEACIHDGFVVIDQHEGIETEFLVHLLRSLQPHFRGQGQTGTQANLNTGIVNAALVPIPPIDEQKQISRVATAQRSMIRAEEAYRDKLQLLKRGLMQDLLTGRVRVPVPESEPELVEVGA
jgi:type I restriction enzyme, S subunit